MSEPKTTCAACGAQILQRTADRNAGLCGVCHNKMLYAENKIVGTVVPADLPSPLEIKVHVPAATSLDSIDWQSVENALVEITMAYVRALAACHADETFYGFAFDCNADYCQVFACLNTEEDLVRQARAGKFGRPDLYGDISLDELRERLRWSLGDWKHQAMTTEAFSAAWEPIEDALSNVLDCDEAEGPEMAVFRESFMQMACRAIVRLEADGAFAPLRCTDDFRVFVSDHDEPDTASWERLNSVRRSLSA